jgi:uncharacterized protein
MTTLKEKLTRLLAEIKSYPTVAVALSGGVDSSLLAFLVHDIHPDAPVISLDTPAVKEEDRRRTKEIADWIGVELILESVPLLSFPNIRSNPENRCYQCKRILFQRLKELAESRGIEIIFEGTNVDDLSDTRPGLRALRELGIQSPYLAAGMTKSDIRRIAAERGLPVWNRPPDACLFTRIPFGEEITPERLHRIEAAEHFLNEQGCTIVRVRDHGSVARIETDQRSMINLMEPDIRLRVSNHLKSLGYRYITLDLSGYQTGSMNPEDVNPHST